MCWGRRILNLNDLHVAADYVILPAAPQPKWKPLLASLHKPPVYHPTAFSNLLFISDVPKSNTWRGAEFRTLRYDEFVNAICDLPELEVLNLRCAVWLTRLFAEELVRRAGGAIGLRKLDFSGCGMSPSSSNWTKKWKAKRHENVRSVLIFDWLMPLLNFWFPGVQACIIRCGGFGSLYRRYDSCDGSK